MSARIPAHLIGTRKVGTPETTIGRKMPNPEGPSGGHGRGQISNLSPPPLHPASAGARPPPHGLDLMQTVPVFAYLVPVLFLFGFGPVAVMIATIIFATPSMVRRTLLALRAVSSEIVEFGRMTGCSKRQLLWKVRVPSARAMLMVGVNQVVMMSLNMVIIASLIGAGGLGFDVLSSLKRLRIGEGIEAGFAITLLAIALDRLSQAFADCPPPEREAVRQSFWKRNPFLSIALITMIVTTALSVYLRAFESFPENLTLTTGAYWDDLVSWVNVNFFDQLNALKTWLLLNLMVPTKRFMLALPWSALVGTRDLGQEVYIALTKADTGRGIVAGLWVVFIAIIADRLISAWSNARKRELGIA